MFNKTRVRETLTSSINVQKMIFCRPTFIDDVSRVLASYWKCSKI